MWEGSISLTELQKLLLKFGNGLKGNRKDYKCNVGVRKPKDVIPGIL